MPSHTSRSKARIWWGAVCAAVFAAGVLAQPPPSDDGQELELYRPPVCSERPVPPAIKDECEVTHFDKKRKRVKLTLTAETVPIVVAGYEVTTENYNGKYVLPIIEADPGDTVAARLINKLEPREKLPRKAAPRGHHHPDNTTNLHFFHGGVVTPRNDRSDSEDAAGAPGKPKGDNVYVVLESGAKPIDYDVPIPGHKELDGGVLDAPGDAIAHPTGLNWYHSHLHGISSGQVLGGLSGLLSVGEATANVQAKCAEGKSPAECKQLTTKLKERTIARYAVLRDILLSGISAHPEDVSQLGPAKESGVWQWDQKAVFRGECPVYEKKVTEKGTQFVPNAANIRLRKGYCQPDGERSAWLFTLNGQRFPSITVESGKNLLLRLGNLSANVAYWLELYNPSDEKDHPPLLVLSLDGVVPASPVPQNEIGKVDAFKTQNLLLMPASRAEIYVQNEVALKADKVYILRAKELDTKSDKWPAVELARVKLKAGKGAPEIEPALNAPVRTPLAVALFKDAIEAEPPKGCVRDLRKGEYRLVTFFGGEGTWKIKTEIMMPPPKSPPPKGFPENEFTSDEKEIVGGASGWSFTEYENVDGTINWLKPHVCVRQDNRTPEKDNASYQQLWVLQNFTGKLHNFHIHQMKFRLATKKDFENHNMIPEGPSSTCPNNNCVEPNYKLHEDGPETHQSKWQDTIPVPPDDKMYIVMSFTAKEQVGRFVFHCHILKHEDAGLMAPIEVWARFPDKIKR